MWAASASAALDNSLRPHSPMTVNAPAGGTRVIRSNRISKYVPWSTEVPRCPQLIACDEFLPTASIGNLSFSAGTSHANSNEKRETRGRHSSHTSGVPRVPPLDGRHGTRVRVGDADEPEMLLDSAPQRARRAGRGHTFGIRAVNLGVAQQFARVAQGSGSVDLDLEPSGWHTPSVHVEFEPARCSSAVMS
jgi:hypothetical protein